MSEWTTCKLEDVVESANTGLDAIRRAPIVEEYTGVKCLRIQDISQNKNFSDWGNSEVSERDFEKARLRTGDIIMARTCSPGIVFLTQKDLDAVFNNGLARIRPNKKKTSSKFLYYLFKSPDFIGHIYGISRGTSVQLNMKLGDLLSYEFRLPPLDEQRRIAAVLSTLDAKIDLLRRQNHTLEQIAQTLFNRWFVEFEFPNEEGQPYKSCGGAMVKSELGEIPHGWRVGALEQYGTIFRGSSPRPITSPIFFSNGTIPWIKIADATKSGSFYISETREFCTEAALPYTRFLEKGSLVLSNSATVGIPMILNLDGCIHDGWLSFKDYKRITRNYLFFTLVNKLKFLVQYADGSVQKNLNTGILKSMEIIVPPDKLIREFDSVSQVVLDKILTNENQIRTLTRLRDALLPQLMSGQLRVAA